MFYDIEKLQPLVFDNVQSYLDFCSQEYFGHCQYQSVLEIGPGDGRHTREILKHTPRSIDTVEGHEPCLNHADKLSVIQEHHDDVMLFLGQPRLFDVVLCLGVLYHLHSPLHLLELIVNHCQPRALIMDCVMAPQQLQLLPESRGVWGSNQPRLHWRSCDVNLVIPFLTYLQVLDHLGYSATKINRIAVCDDHSKHNSWMALWEKKHDSG